MQNKFLNVLWFYPSYAPIRQQKLDAYFESIKEDAMNGDDFASYASFVVDIVCFRKDASITIEQMDDIINSYNYPCEFSERLANEIKCVLGF